MNGFDLFLLATGGSCLLLGAWRGLVRIALGAAGLVVGVILAIRFEGPASTAARRVVHSDLFAPLVAFMAVVVGVVVVFFLAALVMRQLMRAARLGWLDRTLGAVAGLASAILFAGGLTLLLTSGLKENGSFLAGSRLAPYTLKVSKGIVHLAPPDLRDRFARGLERLQKSLGQAKQASVRGGQVLRDIA